MEKTGRYVGFLSGMLSMILWVTFSFFNPYSQATFEPILNTFLTLFLPACLAIAAVFTNKKLLMLIAFIWSFPISFYVMLTPSIFKLFGMTCLLYGISFLLMFFTARKIVNGKESLE